MATDYTPGTNRYGLTGVKQYTDAASAQRRKQLSDMLATAGTGVNKGSSAIGFALGRGLRNALGKAGIMEDQGLKQAKDNDRALKEMHRQISEMPESERETDPFKAQIQERNTLAKILKAQGNFEAADTVKGQVITLMEQEEKFAKLQAEGDKAGTDAENARLQLEADKAAGHARNEAARISNRMATYDLTDPQQRALYERDEARHLKLTDISGKTQWDVGADKVTARKIEDELIATQGTLDTLNTMKRQFKPEYLTYKGKVESFALSQLDKVMNSLDPEDRTRLTEFTQFKQTTLDGLSKHIRALTGAQMSQFEAQRIEAGFPNINDSPEEYQAKLENSMKELRAVRARSLEALRHSEDKDKFREIRFSDLENYYDDGEEEAAAAEALSDDEFEAQLAEMEAALDALDKPPGT